MEPISALQNDTLNSIKETTALFSEHGIVGLSLLVVAIVIGVLCFFIWLNFRDRRNMLVTMTNHYAQSAEERKSWLNKFEKHSDRAHRAYEQNTRVIETFTEELRLAKKERAKARKEHE